MRNIINFGIVSVSRHYVSSRDALSNYSCKCTCSILVHVAQNVVSWFKVRSFEGEF